MDCFPIISLSFFLVSSISHLLKLGFSLYLILESRVLEIMDEPRNLLEWVRKYRPRDLRADGNLVLVTMKKSRSVHS
jgi:hypothetical protein